MKSYIIITPARNEEDYIEKTLSSIVSQTVPPVEWIIVSDGSTDRTDEIVDNYTKQYPFIKLLRASETGARNFGSKVAAFNYGYKNLKYSDYDFIGNLDGDIGLEHNYYEKVLKKFEENSELGIAGGVRMDFIDGKFQKVTSARNSVAGGLQLFRRECFEKIGGYRALLYGGIDAVAEAMARMNGWKVESFTDIRAYHYRPTGSAINNMPRQKFRAGIRYYMIGYHPIFPILRFGSRLFKKPILIGSLISIVGFFWASLCRYKRPVPDDFVQYIRSEQLSRLKYFFKKGKDPIFRY